MRKPLPTVEEAHEADAYKVMFSPSCVCDQCIKVSGMHPECAVAINECPTVWTARKIRERWTSRV